MEEGKMKEIKIVQKMKEIVKQKKRKWRMGEKYYEVEYRYKTFKKTKN